METVREYFENLEKQILAPYAIKSGDSRGRKYPESRHPFRTEFQRDRDRIVHCTAFRRLEYKTQVFVNHEGDHYRTRMTHTIEVSIIARSIARALRLNEDLTEAIALAHDLGHTPYGHSGEEALNELLKDNGGFEHNLQCIRVVELLERRYPDFPGLNLTYELREGILKHHSHYDNPQIPTILSKEEGRPLECQVVNLADEIAYNCHDVDDGLSSGVLNENQLKDIKIWQDTYNLNISAANLDEAMRRHIIVRSLINIMVTDLINYSNDLIGRSEPSSPDEIRKNRIDLISFSPDINKANIELKRFLYHNMYRHFRMVRMSEKARRIIYALYESYTKNTDVLPEHVKARLETEPQHIVVADYIAGMTDRFAAAEFKKLIDPFARV